MQKVDRYPHLGGEIQRYDSLEAVIEAVRAMWPGAYMEGSMGPERTFWRPISKKKDWDFDPNWDRLIGNAWPVDKTWTEYYARIVRKP